MAVQFKIDGTTMPLDPEQVTWEPKEWIARKHSGGPIVNAKRTVHLTWEAMSTADYATLAALCDSAAHTITIPHPDTEVYTLFPVAYLQMASANFQDVHVSRVEIEASYITVT